MSNNLLHFSESAKVKIARDACLILGGLGVLVFVRLYIKYREGICHYGQEYTLLGAVLTFVPVLAALLIIHGSKLPITIEVPSSTTTAKLAAVSDILSMTNFVCCRLHFVFLYFDVLERSMSQSRIWTYGALALILSVVAVTLDILHWTLPKTDRHAFAVAHGTTRILVTSIFVIILFTKNLLKLHVSRGKKIYVFLMLICTTGVFTMPLMGFRLHYYLSHKEEKISAALLYCRISEGGLDIVFICLPCIFRSLKDVFRKLYFSNQQTRPDSHSNGSVLEIQRKRRTKHISAGDAWRDEFGSQGDGSTENILGCERRV